MCTMLDQRRRRWPDVVQMFTNVSSWLGKELQSAYLATVNIHTYNAGC